MASKEVLKIAGLKLTVDGAQQFQSSLKNINAQMKLSSAELQKVTAQYGKNSTATGALAAKKKVLEDKLKSQRQVTTQLNSVLKETEQRYGKNSEEATRMRAKVLESEAAELRLKNQLKQVSLELAKQGNTAFVLGQKLQASGQKMTAFGKKLSNVGGTMTRSLTLPILAAGVGAVKSAMDFESAFTGVRKTVDATEEQLDALKEGILDMTSVVPESAEAIAGVAEAAGQLGIETDNILGFTRVMVDLGVTTNMSSEEGAKSLARFANITQMSQKDFDRLGSVIVDLGNHMATSEAEIVAMGMRLAGTGHQAGLSEAQIMGFAAALSSVGIEAEAGGSAFSRVMTNIQLATVHGGKKLEQFASVAGMSASEFKEKFKTDAAGAIAAFVGGLGKMGGEGKSAIKVLDDMGIKEVRMRDALLRAAGAGDLLTDALNIGTNAWSENGALTAEAEKRYADTASQLKLLWNDVKRLAMEFGNAMLPALRDVIGGIRPLVTWLAGLDEGTKKNIIKMGLFVAALGPVLKVVGKVTSGVGMFKTGLGKVLEKIGTIQAKASVAAEGLGGVASAATGAGSATSGAATAVGGLSSSLVGVVGVAAGAVLAAAAIGTAIDSNTPTVDKFSRSMTDAFESFARGVEGASGVMDTFVSDTTATGEAVETVRDRINATEGEIASAYKRYMSDKGAARERDLKDIASYNAKLRKLMLDEMSAYGAAQQVLADQLRLGTIKVTKENLAGVAKSIGEAKTQATKAAEDIYQEQAKHVLLNKTLTQQQKDDQLRKLAETRDEGLRIAREQAANSAYYARVQLEKNDAALSQRLSSLRGYGKQMEDNEREFATKRAEILARQYTDETQRTRDLQALGLSYARTQSETAGKISDAWLSVDKDTRAAWIRLIEAEAAGGRGLSESTRQTVDAIMRTYATMPGGLSSVGTDMMAALGRGILAEKSPALAASATQADCIAAFKGAYGTFEQVGIQSMNAAGAGVKAGAPKVAAGADSAVSAAVGEFKTLAAAGEKAGIAGIQGLVRGVANAAIRRILYFAAKATAEAANRGVRDVLRPGSPSKVWEQYGKWAGEGLIRGISSEARRVREAAAAFARQAAVGVKGGLALDKLVGTYKDKFAAIKTQLTDLKKSHADSLNAIKATYKQTVASIMTSRGARAEQLGSFGGLFGAGEVKKSETAEQMLANMRKNATATAKYERVLASLTKKNLPKELLGQLSELGVESTAQLQTLNSMTSKELAEYIKLWKAQQSSAAAAAWRQYKDEITAAAAERDKAIKLENAAYEKQAKALVTKVYSTTRELGKAITTGMASGISASRASAIKAATSLAKIVESTITAALKIKSPSKVTQLAGKWTGQGFAEGLAAEEQHVLRAARTLAIAANAGIVGGGGRPTIAAAGAASAPQPTTDIEAMIARSVEKAMSRVTVQLDRRQVGRLVVMAER